MLEDALRLAGCVVVGPMARVEKALKAAREETIDVAILDVNLAGEPVYPVTEVLARRGVPFLLMTGYGRSMLPAKYAKRRVVAKPFMIQQLLNGLSAVLDER